MMVIKKWGQNFCLAGQFLHSHSWLGQIPKVYLLELLGQAFFTVKGMIVTMKIKQGTNTD